MKPGFRKAVHTCKPKKERKDDPNADSGYETVSSKEKLTSVGGFMTAAFAVDKFKKKKILKKQEKRLGIVKNKTEGKSVKKPFKPLVDLLIPYSNISNVFLKKKKIKKWKIEKITLKSLKESMDARNSQKKEN